MKAMNIRNTAIAGFAAVAMLAAGSLAAPTQAHAGGKAAAAFIGGLVVGGLVGSAHAHHRGHYGVVYGPRCHWEKRKVWNPYYGHRVWQKVKVCY
ncbi:MAG: hypothetical protein KDJ67_13710 [Nitratireductor sp.]|nr:hypothetical protein [Nitratireductor sp.]